VICTNTGLKIAAFGAVWVNTCAKVKLEFENVKSGKLTITMRSILLQ